MATRTARAPLIALVTGATSGFGRAIVRRFVADGHNVIALGRRRERLEALQAELGAARVHVVQLDVRDRAATQSFVDALPAAFSSVDILVNNAGLALGLEPAQAANLDDWETMVQTNCLGLAFMTRALLPGMIARGRGHVINIGSTAGEFPYPGGNVVRLNAHNAALRRNCDPNNPITQPHARPTTLTDSTARPRRLSTSSRSTCARTCSARPCASRTLSRA